MDGILERTNKDLLRSFLETVQEGGEKKRGRGRNEMKKDMFYATD